jgi:hypothetical protein
MRGKAASLRAPVRVKGDAEKRQEKDRKYVRGWIQVGMVVDCGFAAPGTVLKVNQKTAKIKGAFGDYNIDLGFISKVR